MNKRNSWSKFFIYFVYAYFIYIIINKIKIFTN